MKDEKKYFKCILKKIESEFKDRSVVFETDVNGGFCIRGSRDLAKVFCNVDGKFSMVLFINRYVNTEVGEISVSVLDEKNEETINFDENKLIHYETDEEMLDIFGEAINEARMKNAFSKYGLYFFDVKIKNVCLESRRFNWNIDKRKTERVIIKKFGHKHPQEIEMVLPDYYVSAEVYRDKELIKITNSQTLKSLYFTEEEFI